MTEQLVERARRGDSDAFVVLIEVRQAAMTRVATAILGSGSDAADAIQDALLEAWRHLPRLRSADAFDPWLERILVNCCRLTIRRRARRRLREVQMSPDAAAPASSDIRAPAGTDAGVSVADRDAFDRAFDGLAIDDRAILVLHHLEGRPLTAIAEAFAIPVGTAKSRLFHARRRLDEALRVQNDDPTIAAPPDRASGRPG